MTSTKLRASVNISAPILHRFNAVVACGERSRAVEPKSGSWARTRG